MNKDTIIESLVLALCEVRQMNEDEAVANMIDLRLDQMVDLMERTESNSETLRLIRKLLLEDGYYT
jgi:hypothetical protein